MLTPEKKDSQFEDLLIECYVRDKYGLCLEPIDTLSSSEQRVNSVDINDSYSDTVVILHNDYDVETKDGCILLRRKRPRFPKTYEECCDVLGKTKAHQSVSGYKTELLEDFQKLLICRDAYLKFLKNWAWDYVDRCFIIANNSSRIITTEYHGNDNCVLAFPTYESRDAFYENFKELIENCKELL
jgi:hypothetical protein